jgi:phospholipase/carboxylesterase
MQSQNSLLPCIEINPTARAIGSVILLHGLGADGNDFVSLVRELKLPSTLPIRFVFPSAPLKPITINNGYMMPAWYDITSMSINQRSDLNGMQESIKQLENLIAHENGLGIPSNKIILAGFSQGAVIAMMTGLNFTEKLAGILSLSGYLPLTEIKLDTFNKKNQDTPLFLAHGTQDTLIPYAVGQLAFDMLKKHHYNAEWHGYAMAHSVCEKEIVEVATWLRSIYES